MSHKILVSLSGGLDSATMLAVIARHNDDLPSFVEGVSFYYGSKHGTYEVRAARSVASHFGVRLRELDLSPFMSTLRSNLILGGGRVPDGHYNEESMKKTVVPGRNMIFLSVLAAIAESEDFGAVYIGAHAGDRAIYPDCRPEFLSPMSEAVLASSAGKVRLHVPFLGITKSQIVHTGLSLNAPYRLTRTCYKDQPVACGRCGSCIERREAFILNGAKDPVEYEYDGPLPEAPVPS
jgi:7-cyano-7-deazaguanine synthase